MTRVCAWCQAELGEKCPHCGSEKLPELLGSIGAGRPAMYWCGRCRHLFRHGQGGVTHAICGRCRAQQLELAGIREGQNENFHAS